MKREDKIAYGIVVSGVFIVVLIFIFAREKRSYATTAKQSLPTASESEKEPATSNAPSASAHQPSPKLIEQHTAPLTDHADGPALTSREFDPRSQSAPTPPPEKAALNGAITAPQISTAVVATLAREDVGPFILKYDPTYNPADGEHITESLWDASSGNVKSAIRNPKYDVYIVLWKASASPSAVGLVFPINKSGWILIPPEFIARIITPNVPITGKIQNDIKRFHQTLCSNLYAMGNSHGLLKFGNGNGMRIDIKEDPEFPESLIFKTTFLPSGSYDASDIDPKLVLAWPDGASIKTISHGKVRPDGWSTFETPRYKE